MAGLRDGGISWLGVLLVVRYPAPIDKEFFERKRNN